VGGHLDRVRHRRRHGQRDQPARDPAPADAGGGTRVPGGGVPAPDHRLRRLDRRHRGRRGADRRRRLDRRYAIVTPIAAAAGLRATMLGTSVLVIVLFLAALAARDVRELRYESIAS
jgi:hypothetical protein